MRTPRINRRHARLLEALLAALVLRRGGAVELRAGEVAACASRYRLRLGADREARIVALAAEPVPLRLYRPPRGRERRSPRGGPDPRREDLEPPGQSPRKRATRV